MPPTLRMDGNQERREDGTQSKGQFTMLIDIDKIEVGDRIRNDTGNLQELADNIKENGLISPITVNKDHVLLAGERRLKACMLLGWEQIPANVMDTRDAEHELNIEISENECRKEFTKEERLDYGRRLERIEAAKAKERQGTRTDIPQNSAECSNSGDTRDKVSKKLGISHDTLKREKYIYNHRDDVDPTEYTDWNEGRTSTNKVYTSLKASEEQETPEVRTCRKCGVELTDDNVSRGSHGKTCKKCHNKETIESVNKNKYMTIDNDPEWTIKKLIDECAANLQIWRESLLQTFTIYAECGVSISKTSIDAINNGFCVLDAAIAGIVEEQ